ncbi:MAG: hypothetical protein OEM05_17380 [Myxococcales bacterium]|nr:hypothetical protein [Myxococcales bacterium]
MRRLCNRRSIVVHRALRRGRAPAWGLALALGLAAACGGASGGPAPLYRWTDAEGSVRYTTDRSAIPRAYRRAARPVAPGGPEAPGLAASPEATDAASEPDPVEAPEPARRVEQRSVESGPGAADLDARIAELEAAIARDQAALKALIAEEPAEGSDSLEQSEALRAIAHRLPGLQAQLRALRAQRAARASP